MRSSESGYLFGWALARRGHPYRSGHVQSCRPPAWGSWRLGGFIPNQRSAFTHDDDAIECSWTVYLQWPGQKMNRQDAKNAKEIDGLARGCPKRSMAMQDRGRYRKDAEWDSDTRNRVVQPVLFWCRNNSAAMFERSIGARCQPGQVSSISISISISIFFPTADLAFAGMGWMAPVGLLTTRPRRSGYHLPIAVWWTFPDNDSTTERTFRRLRYRPGCCFFSSAAWKTGSIKKYGFFVIACSI